MKIWIDKRYPREGRKRIECDRTINEQRAVEIRERQYTNGGKIASGWGVRRESASGSIRRRPYSWGGNPREVEQDRDRTHTRFRDPRPHVVNAKSGPEDILS